MSKDRGIGARARAATVVLTAAAALAALSALAWGHRIDPHAFEQRRFKLPSATWRSVLSAAETPSRRCPAATPIVVLYVSSTCTHCAAELRRWAELVRTNSSALGCIGIVVSSAPNGADRSTKWLPTELVPMLLWDHDRSIARALDVRLVPVATYVTTKGVAISRVVGEASESSTGGHLADLRRISNREGGHR